MASVPGPPVQLAQVRAVFGAPAGTPLNQFYRGGPWVPNIAQNNNVPIAPPIRLAQLAGATNYVPMTVTVPNINTDTEGGSTGAYLGSANIQVSGGAPPFTYNTVHVSGTTFTLINPTAQNPQFYQPGRPPGPAIITGTYQSTVTDSTGATAPATFTVTNQVS